MVRPNFREILCAQVVELMLDSHELLGGSRPIAETITAINLDAAALMDTVAATAVPSRKLLWRDRVLAIRVLDRTIALLSVLDAELSITKVRVFDALCHDASRLLVRVLARARAVRRRPHKLVVSGPIVALVRDGAEDFVASRPYRVDGKVEAGRRKLLGGVVADLLDLMDELGESPRRSGTVYVDPAALLTVRTYWLVLADTLDVEIGFRDSWACGDLLSAERLLGLLGRTADDLARMMTDGRVIEVPSWDGEPLYPWIQFDPSAVKRAAVDPTLWPDWVELGNLMSSIDMTKVAPLAVAIWLGGRLNGEVRASRLQCEKGRLELQWLLNEHGVVEAGSLGAVDMPVVLPDPVAVAKVKAQGFARDVDGNSMKLQERWATKSAKAPSLHPAMYRITSRPNGPFYFSGGSGAPHRFDLSVGGKGTCYISETEQGAYAEVFTRLLVLDIQEAASRLLWELHNLGAIGPLLDISAGSLAAEKLGLDIHIHASRHRGDTQKFAEMVNAAGYVGIIHSLHGSTQRGYALFGQQGASSPEVSGLASWHTREFSIASRADFWEWLESSNKVTPMMNQLPIRTVLG